MGDIKMSFIKTQLLPVKTSKQPLWLLNILNRKSTAFTLTYRGPSSVSPPFSVRWSDSPLQKESIRNWPSLFLYKLLLSWRERQFAHRYTSCLMLAATLHIFALEKSIDTFWNFFPPLLLLLRFIFFVPILHCFSNLIYVSSQRPNY